MRILIISNLYPPFVLGGYEILCQQVVEALKERGHVIDVLTSDHGFSSEPEVDQNIYRKLKLYLPFNQPAKIMRFRRNEVGKKNFQVTKHHLDNFKPNLVFIWSLLRLTLGSAYAAEKSGIPVVYTFNDENINSYQPAFFSYHPKGLAKYVIDNFIFPQNTLKGLNFDNATCISNVVKSNLVSVGFKAEKMKVIYQGIPIENFPVKKDMGKMNIIPKILYLGQLHPYKGVHTILEALKQINEGNLNLKVKITITGEGPSDYKKELIDYAKANNIDAIFTGQVEHGNVSELYREHDIFIFPSIWQEPFGLTHLEAMASGTPVISTAEGGHAEFLIDHENSLVFEKENAKELAAKISLMINDEALRVKLAKNGRSMVESKFTIKRYVDDLEVFLKSKI